MKFALVNEQRQQAGHSLLGKCPICGNPMIAKCGEVRIWHWAHQGKRFCDSWWENESEWHRAWKAQFPDAWQEVVHPAENGKKHIADVRTERGWVIEFQRSYISPEERRSRGTFYRKLIWVVDGTRRKRDREQFAKAWSNSTPVGPTAVVRRLRSSECALLREWAESSAPMFFDFGNEEVLWWAHAGRPDGSVYVAPFSRADFIGIHSSGDTQMGRDFDEFVNDLSGLIAYYEVQLQAQTLNGVSPLPSLGFQQCLASRRRLRRRL